jgi:excisionase family DNA binding protein
MQTMSSVRQPAAKPPLARVTRKQSPPEDTISPGEAARLLAVSPRTLRDWSKKGRISFTLTLGGHRRYHKTDVLLLRTALCPESQSPAAAGTAWELQELLDRIAHRLQALRQGIPIGLSRREIIVIEEDLSRARTIIRGLLSSARRHPAA